MAQYGFGQESCVLVASTAVTSGGTKKYLEQYVSYLMARGINTKLCLLTGSQGMENGQDGMNSLECLSDQQRNNQRKQSRTFYARWCNYFNLDVEGEDPREYNPANGQVTGIKNVATPDWAARKPGRVPGLYKDMKGELSKLQIVCIDIAHYHGKPQELIEVVKKFQPSTLIIDWSFTRGGYTAQQLTASGTISRIIMENELSIITGRGWIKLDTEQKKVLEEIERMEMQGHGDCHDGSITFLQGTVGSGKTMLGLEIGRIIRSKRQLMSTDKEVELVICAPEHLNSLKTLREKSFNIEKMGKILTVEEIFEMYQLGKYEYDKTLDTLNKIGQALSQSGKRHVIVLDDLQYNQDYSKMIKYANVDMVFLANRKRNINILPPQSDKTVRVHELSTSYSGALIGHEVDSLMTTLTDEQKKYLCEKVLHIFNTESFAYLMRMIEGIEQVIVLMVINFCFPTLRPKCQSMCEIPLGSFRSVTKIEQYVKAIESSGVTKDLRGRIFVLGNTGAGKSSFMRTMQSYGQNPKSLTGLETYKKFEKTKVLEMIEDVKFSGNATIIEKDQKDYVSKLEIQPNLDKKQASEYVNIFWGESTYHKILPNFLRRRKIGTENENNVAVTVTDFGGHTEYLLSCKLFFTTNGLYVIMFEAAKISEDTYIMHVGTFVNEILSSCFDEVLSTNLQPSPIICLMASKCDEAVGKDLRFVVGLVEEHIRLAFDSQKDQASLASKCRVFLLDDVLVSSSKAIHYPYLETVSTIFASILNNKEINKALRDFIPVSWFLLQKEMKDSGKVEITMAEAEQMFKDVQRTPDLNVENNEMETIKQLSKVLSEPDVKKLKWEEVKVKDISNIQTLSPIHQHSHLINAKTSDVENSEVETQSKDKVKMSEKKADNDQNEVNVEATEVESIVEFYAGIGDVLHFPKFDNLKTTIIARPMEFIKDCRIIISHDIHETCEKERDGELFECEREIGTKLKMGLVTAKLFDKIFELKKRGSEAEKTKDFLLALNLAVKMEDTEKTLFIPSLVSNDKLENGAEFSKRIHVFLEMKNNTFSVSDFDKIVRMLIQGGSTLHDICYQKIENRNGEIVAALRGTVTVGEKKHHYILQERDDDDKHSASGFSRKKSLQLILKDNEAIQLKPILEYFDKIFSSALGDTKVHRKVNCSECQGYFNAEENFVPTDPNSKCTGNMMHPNKKHEWDPRFQDLAGATQDPAVADMGWKYALVISNDQYTPASGFPVLTSTKEDFKNLVEVLGNDHEYDFKLMGRQTHGKYIAGTNSDFEMNSKDNGFLNTEDVYASVSKYIVDLKEVMKMEMNNKTEIDSFIFYFIGHGVHSNGQDCLMGTTGKATTVKSIQELLQLSGLNAKKYFLFFECCRKDTGTKHKLNDEHSEDYQPSWDTNFTMVYAAKQMMITPDVTGKTMTSCLVEHLRTKKVIKVNELEDTLINLWDKRQKRIRFTPKVEPTPRKGNITQFP